jgi:RNA polymerase sigma factor (sigma-70 family)
MHQLDPLNPWPERYRDYLHLLVLLRMGPRSVGIDSPSDIVEKTLLKAHRNRKRFRGPNEAKRLAFLRQILANTLAQAIREQKNELQLRESLDESSARLESFLLQYSGLPPGEQVIHDELLLNFVAALMQLSPDQRTAFELRYLNETRASLNAIARRLNRPTVRAVHVLLARSLRKLRCFLQTEAQ